MSGEKQQGQSDKTQFRVGSISKPVTAVAVLKLVEKGELFLDLPIPTYAPALPKHMGIVTMRQLLSLRSGVSDHVLLSSVQEMMRWITLLADGKLIDQTVLKEAWTSAPLPDGTKTEYGLGFNISLFGNQKYIRHTGLRAPLKGRSECCRFWCVKITPMNLRMAPPLDQESRCRRYL